MTQPNAGTATTGKATRGGLVIAPTGASALPSYSSYGPPLPDLEAGSLFVTESVVLKAQKFDLQIDFIYNAFVSTEFGPGRTCNLRQTISSQVSGNVATVTRGDRSSYGFTMVGALGGVTTYASLNGAISTLMFDGTQFTEIYPTGQQLTYKAQAPTGNPIVHQLISTADSTGSIHTLNYTTLTGPSGNQFISSVQVPGGQLATFTYASHAPSTQNFLQNLTDWGGRVWTMTYSPTLHQNTSFQTPTGCQTQYAYGTSGMTSHVDPMGYATSYTYAIGFNQTGIPHFVQAGQATWTYTWGFSSNSVVLPSGATVAYNFNTTTGLVSSIQHAEGYIRTLAHDANGVKVQETTPAGTVYSVVYDPRTRQIATEYDGTGNQVSAFYDAFGNLTTLVGASGSITSLTYKSGSPSRNPTSALDADAVVSTYTYYSSGLRESEVDGRGLRTSYAWDGKGNLITRQNSDGSVVTHTFDSLNRLTSVSDELGRTTTLVYDSGDNVIARIQPTGAITTNLYVTCLIQVTIDALGRRTSMTYGRFQNILSVTDALGNTRTTSYDQMGFPIASVDPLGSISTSIYNSAKQPIAQQDSLGFTTTFNFDSSGRQISTTNALGFKTTQIFDTQGRLLVTLDSFGIPWTTTYSPTANPILIIPLVVSPCGPPIPTIQHLPGSPKAMAIETSKIDPLGNISTTIYSQGGRKIASQDPVNSRTSMSYDNAGNMVSYQDSLGNINTTVYSLQNGLPIASISPLNLVTTTLWNSAGEKISVQNSRGFISTMTYNQIGQMLTAVNALSQTTTFAYNLTADRISETSALGFMTTIVYDLLRNPIAIVDEAGMINTTTYDAVSRKVSRQTPLGHFVTNVYDSKGQLISISDPNSNRITNTYDALSRRIAIQASLGNLVTTVYDAVNNTINIIQSTGGTTTLSYDRAGRQIALVDPLNHTWLTAYDSRNSQIETTNPLAFTTTTIYDANGRNIAMVDALGCRTSAIFGADGRVIGYTNALGLQTIQVFDEVGNLVSRRDNAGFTVTFLYDALNRQISEIDQLGFRTTIVYDAQGRVLSTQNSLNQTVHVSYSPRSEQLTIKNELGLVTSFVYDQVSQLVSRLNPSGSFVQYGRDSLSRIVTTTYSTGETVTEVHDPAGNRTLLIDRFGTTTYTYDSQNRMTTQVEPGTLPISYLYDVAGRRVALVEPQGSIRTYGYDSADHAIRYETASYLVTITLDPVNRKVQSLTAPGVFRQSSYDQLGQLLSTLDLSPSGSVLQGFTYTYDPNGNRISVQDFANSYLVSYTHDAKNRLTGEVAVGSGTILPTSTSYVYDSADHLIRNGQTRFILNLAGQINTSAYTPFNSTASVTTYTYDLNGNKTAVQEPNRIISMVYDAENRLILHQEPTQLTTYLYDGLGKKKIEQSANGVATLVWDGDDYLQELFTPLEDSALFITQTPPSVVAHGASFSAEVMFKNVGSSTWTAAAQYEIVAQAPTENEFWGFSRLVVPSSILPGQATVITATFTAPNEPGFYPFQWRMNVAGVPFGQNGDLKEIQII